METKINININDKTVDFEVRGLSLNHVSNLSTIGSAVADNLKASLILLGADPDKASSAVSHLLQGNYDIEYILKSVL